MSPRPRPRPEAGDIIGASLDSLQKALARSEGTYVALRDLGEPRREINEALVHIHRARLALRHAISVVDYLDRRPPPALPFRD